MRALRGGVAPGVAPPATLSGFARGGFAPCARGVYFARIIYDLITVINNSGIENTTPRRQGAQPPRAERATICTLTKMRNERTASEAYFLRVHTLKHQLHRPIHIIQIQDSTILIV